jgi:hypothetical protein
MPRWDFECPVDGTVVERVYPSVDVADKATEICPVCVAKGTSQRLVRKTPVTTFAIAGFSEKNGYGVRE